MSSGPAERLSPPGDQRLALATRTLIAHRDPISGAQVRALVDAAADAGFTDIAMWSEHFYWATADDMSAAAFFGYHRDRGLGIPVMEVIFDWESTDRAAVAAAALPVLEAAALAGSTSVIATTLKKRLPPMAEAAQGMRHLCGLAAERGLRVSFEILPFTAVPTITSAIELFDAVGAGNLGLVLDTWHWFRAPGGPDLAALRDLPPERVHVLQLNDAPAEPEADLIAECMNRRLLPGEGAIGIAGLLAELDDMGATPVIAPEVFSASLAELGPAAMAQRIFAATQAVLRTAGRR
jgi:sugar phosphate isomerase/epimerase